VKGLQEGGLPPKAVAKAGFLPGEAPKELSPEDRIKKNEHAIAGLERKQRALDLDDPKDSSQWDEIQSRIHQIESESEDLRAGTTRRPSRAQFMPGDHLAGGEFVKSAAVRHNEEIFEDRTHPEGTDKAILQYGITDPNSKEYRAKLWDGDDFEEGYTTTKGRFLNREDALKLARRGRQLERHADPEDTELDSMDFVRPSEFGKASFMPGEAPDEEHYPITIKIPNKAQFLTGAKLEKPKWDEASEPERQKYLKAKVKQTLANQHTDPATVPLKVLRKPDGGIQYDPQGNPVYEPGDYGIAESPMLGKKALSKIASADIHAHELGTEQHPYLTQVDRRRLSALREVSAVDTFGDKIVDSYDKVKDQPDIAAGKSWYSTMRQKLLNALGPHNEIFAQLLGATSAKTPVRSNFIQALDAYEQWLKGMKDPENMKLGFNRHIAKYLEAYNKMQEGEGALSQYMRKQGIIPKDENGNDTEHVSDADALGHWIAHHDILPRQQNGKKFNSNSNSVLKVLAGTWLKEVGAPKTPNFAGNLTGRTLEATIDVWAARHLKQIGYEGFTDKPWRHQPAAEQGVSALDFAFSQDAMRNAADKIGIDPDALQATLWFAQKQYHQSRSWTRGEGAKKSSFDDVFDKVFAKTGEPMTAADARAHYQAVSDAEAKLKARIKTAQDIQANRPHKLDAYMAKHGLSKEVLAHAGDTTEDEGE